MNRIEKMKAIAKENGVKATIKEMKSGITFASINGKTFKVRGLASFEAKCKELKNYVHPAPIELTSRLTKIENAAVSSL